MVDSSDPAQSLELGFYDSPDSAYDVALVGDYAYLTDGRAGLRVIDVSNPAQPVEIGYYETLGYAEDIVLAGGSTYLADGSGGLLVLRAR
jgi:hypothetical protein